MAISISCNIIRLLLFTVHIVANELNVLEPGTQVYPILSQDNIPAISTGSATASSENMVDYALQQDYQHSSNPNPLLLANENLDCAASSSNIIQPSAERRIRMRYKRGGGGNGAAVCEWQEFKEDSPETTTTTADDVQLRGKKRRPKPRPSRDPGQVGPLKIPDILNNLAPAPYKINRDADPQQCPFGDQNIPVCYPKEAIPQDNPALIISPCRIDEHSDPCVLDLEDLWCCREIYTRVPPSPSLIPLKMRFRIMDYNQRYPNSASFCIGVLDPPPPPYPIWIFP